ncbi:unnamed protein product [Calypogeia fissa]
MDTRMKAVEQKLTQLDRIEDSMKRTDVKLTEMDTRMKAVEQKLTQLDALEQKLTQLDWIEDSTKRTNMKLTEMDTRMKAVEQKLTNMQKLQSAHYRNHQACLQNWTIRDYQRELDHKLSGDILPPSSKNK